MKLSVFSTSQMVCAAHVASQKHVCKLEDLSSSMTSYGLFDDHLLTIDTDYRVVVSTNLQEIAFFLCLLCAAAVNNNYELRITNYELRITDYGLCS